MRSHNRILIVEDEPDIANLIAYNLRREGFEVLIAGEGRQALQLVRSHPPLLILLDLMLPDLGGLEVCRRLKQGEKTSAIPVIMVTAKGEETDVVVGLEMGADDYVVKPFSVKELMARVRAVLRRPAAEQEERSRTRIEAGAITVDLDRHEVRVHGKPVELTLAEFRLLHALLSNRGRVLTRDQLLDRITEERAVIIDRNVDVHIGSVRRKLGDQRDCLLTVRGVGYKWKE